jgi:hypothetical protein
VGLGNVAKGNAISNYLIANADKYGLKGLIWNAQSNFGSGWRPYGHPGGFTDPTRAHLDHVHAEFFRKGGYVHPQSFDRGGTLKPGWNMVRNDTGTFEHLTPGSGGIQIGQFVAAGREDVDEFFRRAEFHLTAGAL